MANPQPATLNLQPILIAGPTASGKSDVALLLAEKLSGEIISVDSMQVYRGMDIGTAKPTREVRARVPHHLIDVAEVSDPFDAAQFVTLAREVMAQIQSREKIPILCGGTGLYFKALLEGLGDSPPSDAALRAELETTPLPDLLGELSARDPATYARIDRKNPRRVIRAVEVIRLTAKPFSAQRAEWLGRSRATDHPSPRGFGLTRSLADLHARIDARVEEMFRRGLVAETEALLKKGLAENKTAMQALGYRQVIEHLRGERSLLETMELVKLRTRHFAKRQLTWFRGQMQLEWIQIAENESFSEIAQRLARHLQP
jgi:tRNA dimethylallyltransferase